MAVKKTTTKKVEKHIVDDILEQNEEVTPEVEIDETPVVEEEQPEVEINTEINEEKMPKSDVRIKMKENHNCWIGKTHYVLKKGQCYNVPKEVKMRLSRAGLLLPL